MAYNMYMPSDPRKILELPWKLPIWRSAPLCSFHFHLSLSSTTTITSVSSHAIDMNRSSNSSMSTPRSSRSQNDSIAPGFAHFDRPCATRIPTEVVDHIIAFVLSSSSHSFASIASVSLASSDFRQIALRLFFSTIKARSRTRWSKLWNVLASVNRNGDHVVSPHSWVRYVLSLVCMHKCTISS
jgi:hypothetical protein